MPASPPSKKVSAPARPGRSAGGRSARPFKVDNALLKTLKKVPPSQPLVVMFKLRREGAKFAELPMSNELGNARARAFADEVQALMTSAGGQDGLVRIVQRAANVGVATVEAPASVVKRLADSAAARLETLGLARDGAPS